jgi:uncharacterized membrane protein YfcA
MQDLTTLFPVWLWGASIGIAFLAGVVKGIVGFALPLVIVLGLGSLTSPEVALAGLILPTVVTNIMQAFRLGMRSAVRATLEYRQFLIYAAVALVIAAQAVPYLSEKVYLLIIGVVIVAFIGAEIAGWTPKHMNRSRGLDAGFGTVAGVMGGIAGVWGAPTVAYLTALNTTKAVQIQVQGVIYLSGALALVVAHLASGILNREMLLFSAVLVPTAMLGMTVGTYVQDRINQKTFRRATLVVLLFAGLNLVRRGLIL